MRICIVALVHTYENSTKLYNTQDIGLGRAFASIGHHVQVIHFEKRNTDILTENLTRNLCLTHYKSKGLGNNSLNISKKLPTDVELMICFSDIQVCYFEVYRHCVKNNIMLFPYVGVIESHSKNRFKRYLMHYVCKLNIRLYKKQPVISKSNMLKEEMLKRGVQDVHVMPIGLDIESSKEALTCSPYTLRKKMFPNIADNAPIFLFVGRLTQEKRPLEAIDLFYKYKKKHPDALMIVIGKGDLLPSMLTDTKIKGIHDSVFFYSDIPNSKMWQYYLIADISLNCSRVEIFGMSILEAMYCECPVVAYAAPGPQMIIENEKDGFLYHNVEQAYTYIEKALQEGKKREARRKVEENFTWKTTATRIEELYKTRR